MISLKYGIILGAILIIGIYFAYKGSIIKEGLIPNSIGGSVQKLSYIRGGGFTDKAGVHHKADGWVQSWFDERGAQAGFSPDGDWEKANSQIYAAPTFGPPDTAIITADDSNKEESGYGGCQMYINTEFTDHAPADPPQPVSDPAGGIDSPAFAWANLPTTGWKVATAANSSNGWGYDVDGLCPNIDPTPPTLEAGKTCSTFDCKAAGQTPNPNIDNVNSYCNENTCTAEQCCLAPALVCSSSMCNPQTQLVKGANVPCNGVTDIIVSGNASFQINGNTQSINGTYKFCPAESGKCLSSSYHHQWIMTPPSGSPAAAAGLYGIIGPGCQGACTWYLQWAAAGGDPGDSNNWQNTITCPGQHQSKCDQPVASWTCAGWTRVNIPGGGLCNAQNLTPDVVGANPTPQQLEIPTGTWIPGTIYDIGGMTPGTGNPIISLKIACTTDECCIPKPTCDTLDSCDPNWTPKATSTLCASSPCINKDCCNPPTCGPYKCLDTTWTKISNISDKTCPNNVCDDNTCCQPTCASFTCQTNWKKLDGIETKVCGTEGCEGACCQPTCDAYPCQSGTQKIPNIGTQGCGTNGCKNELCCVETLKCSTFFNDCPPGYHPNSTAATDDCSNNSCTKEQCCIQDTCDYANSQSALCGKFSFLNPDTKTTKCGPNCDLGTCCLSNPFCGDSFEKGVFTCSEENKAYFPKSKEKQQCLGETCTSGECCADEINCGSFVGNCNKNRHVKDATTLCTNRDGTCDDATCCVPNDQCNKLPKCNPYRFVDDPSQYCAASGCTEEHCCVDNPRCGGMNSSCGNNYYIKNKHQVCKKSECDPSECCVEDLQCGSFVNHCKKKRHVDDKEKYCPDKGCSDEHCCIDNPFCDDFACPQNYYLKDKTPQCKGATCTRDECCLPDPTCGTFEGCDISIEHIGDKNKVCLTGTCDNETCCVPNIQCGSYKGKCAPGKHIVDDETTCYNNSCTDAYCCNHNAKCGQFDDRGYTCPDTEYIKQPDKTCLGKECTQGECCVINPTCKTYTCPPYQHIQDPTVSCPKGECSDLLCCEDNVKCSSFKCPIGKHIIESESWCENNECTEGQCCEANPPCSSFQCGSKYTLINKNKICDKDECSNEECCELNPVCSNFACDTGYTIKSKSSSITCSGISCTNKDCCLQNQTCSTHNCPTHKSKIDGNYACSQKKCTNQECCESNARCSSYKCESDYYNIRTLVNNAEDIYCAGPVCLESECCDVRSSGKLPKVNTWPIYS